MGFYQTLSACAYEIIEDINQSYEQALSEPILSDTEDGLSRAVLSDNYFQQTDICQSVPVNLPKKTS